VIRERTTMDNAEAIQQHCTPLLKALMNNKNAAPFNCPVDYIKLGIPDYPKIIAQPMDFGTVEAKLNSGVYETIDDWVVDVRTVFGNARTFNPADHIVHKMAKLLEANFDKRLASLLEKVESKHNGGAGRKNDSSTESDWIKKAKTILKSTQEHPEAYPFLQPVDWKKLKIPDYPTIVTRPMDLSKVEKRIKQMQYTEVGHYIEDVNLVWHNAMIYNADMSPIHQMASKLKSFFEESCAQAFGAGGHGKRKRSHDEGHNDVPMPDEPNEDEKTRPVTVEEKRDLNEKINMLESEDLGKMVEIIKTRCLKCIDMTSDDGIEIDIDLLEPGNLRYVAKFVTACCDRYVVS
jgi:hypothetical protein